MNNLILNYLKKRPVQNISIKYAVVDSKEAQNISFIFCILDTGGAYVCGKTA